MFIYVFYIYVKNVMNIKKCLNIKKILLFYIFL